MQQLNEVAETALITLRSRAVELCERIPRSSTSGLASTIKINNQSMIPRSLLRGESISENEFNSTGSGTL